METYVESLKPKRSVLKLSLGVSFSIVVAVMMIVVFTDVAPVEAGTWTTSIANGATPINWNTVSWTCNPVPTACVGAYPGAGTGDIANLNVGINSFYIDFNVPNAITLTVNATSAVTLDIRGGGNLTLQGSNSFSSGNTLMITGGTLKINTVGDSLSLASGSAFTWSGGTLNGSGTATVNSGVTVTMSNSGNYTYLDTATLNNAGTFNYTPGPYYFLMYNGAKLNNSGTFDTKADGQISYSGSGSTITNTGAFTKSLGSGALTIGAGVAFNNSGGTVNANSGNIALNGGGTSSGTFSIPSGATVDVTGGVYTLTGGTFSGLGDFRVTGGTLTVSASVAMPSLIQSGGTINGSSPNVLTVTSLTWSGGTMGGSGTTSIPGGGTVTMVNSSAYTTLDTRTFNNAGTFNYTPGPYYLLLYNGAQLNNSGTFDVKADGQISYSGSGQAINNTGAFTKSLGSGTLTIGAGVPFNNNGGTVNANNGTIGLTGGGTSSGTFNIASGATVDVSGSTYTLTGGAVAGLGAFRVNGGTLTVSANIGIPNLIESSGTINGASPNVLTVTTLTWSGGTMSGTGTTSIPGGGTVTMVNSSQYTTLDTRTFNNAGTFNYTPSPYYFSIYNGANFNNSGTFNVLADGSISYSGSGNLFTNTGTFTKSGGSGTMTIGAGLAFNNTGGTIAANSGTISSTGGGTGTGIFTAAASGTLTFAGGTFTLTGASTVNGAGIISFTGGTVNASGTFNVTGTTAINGGTLNLSAAATTGTLTMSQGTLGGTATLTVSTAATLSGGTMTGGGTTTLNGPTSATVATNYITLDNRVINNNSAFTYVASPYYMQLANGTIFNNNTGAVFDIQNDQNVYAYGTASTFKNFSGATLKKTAGTGTSAFYPILNNDGSVLASSGTLNLIGGGTSNGSFSASATLAFGGGTHTLTATSSVGGAGTISITAGTVDVNGTYNPAGATSIGGGQINLNTAATTGTLTMTGGTLAGAALLTVSGASTLSGGTMTGGGTTTFNGPTSATVATNYITIDNRVINNNSTFTYIASPYYMQLANGATFNNNSGAVFDIQNDQIVYAYGTPTIFKNFSGATLKKTAGTGTSTFYPPLNNDNTVLVSSGTLSLVGGGTSNGSFSVAGTLVFGGGTHTLTASSTIGGTGTVSITSGTVDVSGTYNPGVTSVTGGQINFNSAATTGTFTMSSGTVAGTAVLTVSGAATLSGGTMTGGGTTTFNGAVTITAATNYITIDNRVINNNNTVTYTGSPYYMQLANGTTFNNNSGATFDIQNDQIIYAYGTTSTFKNLSGATFKKTAGTGTTTFYPVLNNDGTLLVASGTLSLNGGGTSPGTFTVNSGATLNFGGGTAVLASGVSGGGGVVSSSGGATTINGTYNAVATTVTGGTLIVNVPASLTALTVSGGEVDFNGATVTTNTLTISNGTIGGTANLTVSTTSSISGGTINGGGTINFNGAVTLTAATNYTTIDNRTVNNNVSFTYIASPYYMQLANGTTFNNNSGAIFDIQNDQIVYAYGAASTFKNFSGATLKKSAGTGTSAFYPVLNNDGSLLVSAGTLSLIGGGTSNGTFSAAGGTTLAFAGGSNFTLNASSSVGGATISFGNTTVDVGGTYNPTNTAISTGTVNFNSTASTGNLTMSNGTIAGSGAFTVNSSANITGGSMSGTGTTFFAAAAAVTVDVSTNYLTISRAVTNAGTLTYTGSPYYMQFGGGTFTNNGMFNIQTDQIVYGFGSPTFVNGASGTFKKTTGTSTQIYVPFTNNGTVLAAAGEMNFSSFTQSGGTTTLGPGSIKSTTLLAFNGGILNGTGTVTGDVSNAGSVNPGTSPGVITITGNYTQTAAGVLNVELNGTTAGTTYDQLNVGGTATLNGTLNATLGYTPANNDTYKVLTFATRSGDFATKNLPTFGGGGTISASYIAGPPPALQLAASTLSADLAVTQSASPANISVNQTATFTINVTNNGPNTSTGITVSDTFTGGTFTSVSSTAGTTCSGTGPVTCTIANLNVGATETITLTLTGNAPGTMTNNVTATPTTSDPNMTNNTPAPANVVVGNAADVSVTFVAPPASIPAGTNATFNVQVSNAGPSSVAPTLNISMSGGTIVTAAGGIFSCTNTSTTASCTGTTLNSGANSTLSLIVQAQAQAGTLSVTATAGPLSGDPVPSNNGPLVQTATVIASADLQITKVGAAALTPGQPTSYTITVKNLGPSDATGVSVSDSTPAGLTFTSNSGACATAFPCALGPLTAGQTATITANYNVGAAASGNITNSATVSATTADPGPSNNTATATGTAAVQNADLSIAKSGPSSANPGTTITYTITIVNVGPGDAPNVSVADPTPSRLTFVSATAGCTSFPCSLGTVLAGQSKTIQATYTVGSGSTAIVNTATVTSSAPDPNSGNNSASVTTTGVCPTAAPSISSPSEGQINVGTSGTLTWTSTGASSYNVYLDVDPNGCSKLIATTTIPSLPYGGLLPGTKYRWRIEGLGQGCPTKSSVCASFTTQANCPNAAPTLIGPLNTTVVPATTFTWSAVAGATNYRLFVNGVQIAAVNATTYATTLANGPVTWYVIADFGALCPSLTSQTGAFTVCDPTASPALSVVAETVSNQGFDLQFNALPASSYQVDESTDANFTTVTTQTIQATNASVVTVHFQHNVNVATAFFYRARAFLTCLNAFGPYSATARIVVVPVTVTTTETNPNVPVPVGSTQLVGIQVHIDGLPGQTLPFTATLDNKPWLVRVEPASGLLPPEGLTFTVFADPTGLPNGTFTGTVILLVVTPGQGTVRTNGVTTISAPVSISLVTPVTPQPASIPPATALIIPSVGHLDGLNSKWQSDIRIGNVSAASAKYQLTFTPDDASKGVKQTILSVDAGATTALDDIIKTWYGVGVLGDTASGVLEIRPAQSSGKGSPSPDDVSVSLATVASSRTYNVASTGTLGQFIPAIRFSSFVGKALDANHAATILGLQQIAQSDAYRTNLGVVEASGQPASVMVSAYDSNGTKLLDIPLDLKGGEQRQLNSFLAQNKITNLADGRLEVKVTGGEGKITAYASVVDNKSGDPLLVSGVPIGQNAFDRFVLPGVADLNTGVAAWRTDARVFNPTTTAQFATLTFYPQNNSGEPQTTSVTINPGEVKKLDNALSSFFGLTNTGGALHVTTAGAAPLVVTGRTYNLTSNGTFGQFIPAVTSADAVGKNDRALQILQAEDSVRYRTNLGVAEVTGKPATVEVQVFLPDSKISPSTQIPLPANGFIQVPVIQSLGLTNVYNVRISLRVVDGDGKISAYGSVIDQKTNDPTYVPAQ